MEKTSGRLRTNSRQIFTISVIDVGVETKPDINTLKRQK